MSDNKSCGISCKKRNLNAIAAYFLGANKCYNTMNLREKLMVRIIAHYVTLC